MLCLAAQSCPTLCDPMDCSPPGYPVHGDSPGKNTGVGCYAFLQGILATQGSNPVFHIVGIFFTIWAIKKGPEIAYSPSNALKSSHLSEPVYIYCLASHCTQCPYRNHIEMCYNHWSPHTPKPCSAMRSPHSPQLEKPCPQQRRPITANK